MAARTSSLHNEILGSVHRVEDLLRLLEVDPRELQFACGFLPVRLFAELWGMKERELVDIWRREPHSPQLSRLKRGRYLVRVADILPWIERRAVDSPDQIRRRTSVIRRMVSDAP